MEFGLDVWFGFLAFICAALVIDLGLLNKKPKTMSFKDAATMTVIWVLLASLFCTFIYFEAGHEKALEFITGYIVELSLSMDNVFIFILIFSYFKVPPLYQHRVLFWGILGAIIMRFIMIIGGVYLFSHFEFLFFLFGVFLIYTGFKIAMSKESEDMDIKNNKVLNYLKKVLPVTKDFEGSNFVVRVGKKLHVTPLFIVLVLIEQTDLIFALDSIPAIFAITRDPFIVFTSNIFAILGLRSLYFLLADLVKKFIYLKYGIGVILAFVGLKMILAIFNLEIPISWSLLFIISVLGSSIGYSLVKTAKSKPLSRP